MYKNCNDFSIIHLSYLLLFVIISLIEIHFVQGTDLMPLEITKMILQYKLKILNHKEDISINKVVIYATNNIGGNAK